MDFTFDKPTDPVLAKTGSYSLYLQNSPKFIYGQGLRFLQSENTAVGTLAGFPTFILTPTFTLMMWYNRAQANNGTLFQKYVDDTTGIKIYISSNKLYVQFDFNYHVTDNPAGRITANKNISTNWTQVIIRVEFVSTQYKVSIRYFGDASTVTSSTGLATAYVDDIRNDLYIGNSKDQNDAATGTFWQVKIWNHFRTDAELDADTMGKALCGSALADYTTCLNNLACSSQTSAMYPNFQTSSCSVCPEGCNFCIRNTDCSACYDPYCQSCDHFFEGSPCSSCVSGFALNAQGLCEVVCKADQWKDLVLQACFNCDIACDGCSGNGDTNCIKCAAGYALIDNQCVPDCPAGTYAIDSQCTPCTTECKGCSDTGCMCSDSFGDCVTWPCESGEFLNGDSCEPCDVTCKTCAYNANFCTSCYSNTFLSLDRRCLCQDGFYLKDNVCTKYYPTATFTI